MYSEMDSLNAKRENGTSFPLPLTHVQLQHRRSRSASEKNLEVSRDGFLRSVKKDHHNGKHMPPARVNSTQSPLIRRYPSPKDNKIGSSNHRASLEQDLQQEKCMRMVLERAMGRASSTLSPGHRHFSTQTKELIAEIELLEEEVANREQHVLSLYRNIFEESVSRASSSVASPARTKQQHTTSSRKHPSVISTAFCSSKSFPFRPLQALVSITASGNKSFKPTDPASLYIGKGDIHFEKACLHQIKAYEKISGVVDAKSSMVRTLKDHLYQCPVKLSEDMVRGMAAVYFWLRSSASTSPVLSRSSTNVALPRHGRGDDHQWSCKSMVAISWISTDKNHFSRASFAINNYRNLVEQLEKVTFNQMENNARIAFWINVYNALVMHAYLAYGIPHSSIRRLALFHKAAYNIGGHIISANAIEQSIFCLRTHRVGKWLETILSTAWRKKSGEDRQLISSKFGLLEGQPLVCFALCTGAFSDPLLKVYTASGVKEELEAAKREFLQANVTVKKSKKVFLPKLIERFAKEASISSDNLLKWVTENVDKKLHDSILKCMDHKSSKKASQIIEWLPYSSKFQYAFSKDLTEKPSWI